MKILLFNDNPVVRKLVALSAQKTKDDLTVIVELEEINESEYDLLIIDDALYSDETFAALKELVTFKSSLLMATRSNAVPAGFKNVINKPFLPTDLVEMFIQIDRKIAMETTVTASENETPKEPLLQEISAYAINLDETFPKLKEGVDELNDFDLSDLGEIDLSDHLELESDFDPLEDFEDSPSTIAILDKEEVQEVKNLLDDTENDDWNFEGESLSRSDGVDALNFSGESIITEDLLDDHLILDDSAFDFTDDFETLSDTGMSETEDIAEDLLLDDELFSEGELPEAKVTEDEFGALEGLDSEVELPFQNSAEEMLLDDQEFGELESQIEDAISDLTPDILDKELEFDSAEFNFDDAMMEELTLSDTENEGAESHFTNVLDELDTLNERDLMLAMGEEVETEFESENDVENSALSTEVLEALNHEEDFEKECSEVRSPTHAEGVEALQALLKALSNEEVAASLKGLNISININFGNNT